jgi:hypothetical protein
MLIFFIALLLSAVHADSGITAFPANLTIGGSRDNVPVRTIILTASQDITDLSFLAPDLESSTGKTFPATLIRATRFSSQMTNGSNQPVSLRFDLPKAPDTGSFTGEIWVSSANGTTKIPVTVTVRDGWLPPLVVLVAGVLVSLLMWTYETRGKKRDEILQAVGYLCDAMKLDTDLEIPYAGLPNPFSKSLNDSLKHITQKVFAGDLDDAATLLQDAKKTWDKWIENKVDWINAGKNFEGFIEYLKEREDSILSDPDIPQTLKDPSKGVRYIRDMKNLITSEFGKLHEAVKPETFKSVLDDQSRKEQQFHDLYIRMMKLAYTCKVGKKNCPPCHLIPLWTSFINASDLSSLEKYITAKEDEVAKCEDSGAMAAIRREQRAERFTLTPTPSQRAQATVYDLARLRLKFYRIGSFLVTLVILVSIGYSQLYLADPTFGSPGNYATLALWGLLAGSFSEALIRKTGTATFGVE